jgi:hypothetical protein
LSQRCLEQLYGVGDGLKTNPAKSARDLYARWLPVLETVNTELKKRGFTLPSGCPEQFDKRLKANPPENALEFREQLGRFWKRQAVRYVLALNYLEQLREGWSSLKTNQPKSQTNTRDCCSSGKWLRARGVNSAA